jgi:hypothetical protein
MQDGASVHTAAATMAYLATTRNVLLKSCIKELGPETKEELIDVIVTACEGIKMSLMKKRVDSMPG